MNNKPTLIKNWEELAKIPESDTHYLEIEDGSGCIVNKYPKSGDPFLERESYLSIHTFYGSEYQRSTKPLKACGFNVELVN